MRVNTKTYTIDRFEEGKAVLLLSGNEVEVLIVERDELPKETKEGDVVTVSQSVDGSRHFAVEQDTTAERRNKAEGLLEKLKNKKN